LNTGTAPAQNVAGGGAGIPLNPGSWASGEFTLALPYFTSAYHWSVHDNVAEFISFRKPNFIPADTGSR